jgi:hypothetical protein
VGAENVLGAGDMVAEAPTEDLRVTSTDLVPGDSVGYSLAVRGTRVGGGIVSTEMTADRSPGTAIVETRIVVVPSRTGFMRVE